LHNKYYRRDNIGRILFSELDEKNKRNNKSFFESVKTLYFNDFKSIQIKKGFEIKKLIREGNLYYVKKGVIMRYFFDYHGFSKALDIVMEDEILGLATLMNKVPVESQLLALTNIELIVIPKKVVLENILESFRLLYMNYQYYISMHYLHWQVSQSNGEERVQSALIFLSHFIGETDSEGIYLPSYIGQKEIAEFACVTPSYVSKIIKKLAAENIVKVINKKTVIIDQEELISLTPYYQEH